MKSYSSKKQPYPRMASADNVLVVSPELRSVLATNLVSVLVCIAIPIGTPYIPNPLIRIMLNALAVLLLLYLVLMLYRANKTTWTITENQLVYKRGVFSISVDYMELYRVNDYTERMNFIDNLIGVKTVTIHTSDRTNSTLTLYGIDNRIDVVSLLRTNVEHSKTLRNVYEIANR